MSFWGAIIGGTAGLAIGGPIGGLIGAIAGHAMARPSRSDSAHSADLYDSADFGSATPEEVRSAAFTVATVALGAKMAKADGVVTSDEVAAFKEVFRVPRSEEKNLSRLFKAAHQRSEGFEPYAQQIAKMFSGNPAVLEQLLFCLTHIARADGTLHQKEIRYLLEVSKIFGLDSHAFERVTEITLHGDNADPWRILGVASTVPDSELKSAYRKLIRENHPDRLIAQGMPEEAIRAATERLAAINHAYDVVSAKRGLS